MPVEAEAREFQETILRSISQHSAPYLTKLRGQDFVMFPETFNPAYAKAALLLLENLGVEKGDVVLDPFTGCGADAIFAVLEGAERAVAIEKFTMPYLCARYNAYSLGLEEKVDVRQGDLFGALKKNEKFDLVVANPPFRRRNPGSNIESAIMDKSYITLNGFWNEVGDYLKPKGRIRTMFSNVGDFDYFLRLAKENGYSYREVVSGKYASTIIIRVHEFKRASS